MDEDPEIPEVEAEESSEEAPRMTVGAAIAVFVAGVTIVALAIYFGVAQTVAGLFFVIGIPLVLIWFVWKVFLRRLWRIRGMRTAQERRELMEAALRDKKTNHEGH
ncbi:MAG: hypothetical protein ROO76_19805 [Terriglobia bacterium]|jgi:Flp pilus assembly protein TadB|nr:hypothetical protein [Terriglobia bacterium]